jgi:hypothetical protein
MDMRRFLLGLAPLLAHCTPHPAPAVTAPTLPGVADGPAKSAPVAAVPDPAPVEPPQPTPSAEESRPEIDDIAEAVLRHMLTTNASGAQQSAGVCCLDLRGADPPPEFLARFHDVHTPVRKASDCDQSSKGVFEKGTNRRGLVFRVETVRWSGGDAASAQGGYYEAGLSASGNTYTLERKAGRWTVVKDEMNWIS